MIAPSQTPASLFRQHIVRSSRFLLQRLEAESAEKTPNPDAGAYLNVLGYAVRTHEAWPHVSRMLILLAPQMERAGHRHDWIEQLRSGIRWSQAYKDAATEAELRMQLGHLHQLMGDYEEAKRQLHKSLLLFAGLEDKTNRARVWYRLAATYRSQRNYEQATHLVRKALNWFEANSIDAAHGHFRLGAIYNDLGQYEQAVDQFLIAIDSCERAGGDVRLQAWSHANIGFARMRVGYYEDAREYFFAALEYFARIDDPVNEAVVTLNLGAIHDRLNDYEQALAYFNKAKLVFRKTHELPRLAIVYNNSGTVLRKLNRYDEAVESHEMSIDISRRLGDKKELANAVSGIAAVAQAQNRHGNALSGFEQALVILEEIRDRFDVDSLMKSTRELQRISLEKAGASANAGRKDNNQPH